MSSEALLLKLQDALNAHDIETFVSCFDENYYSEQPVHPDRTFRGREQVRKNWSSNFDEMPDFSAQLIRYTINHDSLWGEWEWQGTRKDKSKMFMRGVLIFGLQNNKITWGRLYIEPVEASGKGIDAAVKEVMQGKKK